MAALRIGVVGGVPASLGGGGLELQVRLTTAALRRAGHEVVVVAHEPEPQAFDVLHAFSSGPDVAFVLSHWRRSAGAPLVLSPVMVVPPGRPELRQRVAHRLPIPEFGPWQRRELLRRADALVALTEHEAALLRDLGGGRTRIEVIGNGVDPVEQTATPDALPDGYVVMLGSVGPRKRQLDVARLLAAAGGPPPVLIGGLEDGTDGDEVHRVAADAGGVWLGEVSDPGLVRAVLAGASALVHLSSAEGQSLAVLEALSEGTPVALAPLPGSRELAAAYPGWVALVESDDRLVGTLASLAGTGTAPEVPTWDDVAARLSDLYASLV